VRTRRVLPLLPLLLAASCSTPEPRYLVGAPYSLGGVWSYPREDFALVETGLATREAGPGWNTPTANGEEWSASRALAAHRTLQLPAVVTVTNLENGSSLTLRVNDRGPVHPGRVIGLSDRAADLLGMPSGRATQVSLSVDGERSRAIAEAVLGRAPEAVAIETAPRAAVASESLAPPPGARAAAPGAVATPVAAAAPMVQPAASPAAIVLPETVTHGTPSPGRIVIEAGTLSRADAAQRLAARIPGGRVEAYGPRRDQRFRVRAGPYSTVAQADAALERTLAAGVFGARILVD
jgi:rare lipoprotein A